MSAKSCLIAACSTRPQADAADAGADELLGDAAAECAAADEQDARRAEAPLPGIASSSATVALPSGNRATGSDLSAGLNLSPGPRADPSPNPSPNGEGLEVLPVWGGFRWGKYLA